MTLDDPLGMQMVMQVANREAQRTQAAWNWSADTKQDGIVHTAGLAGPSHTEDPAPIAVTTVAKRRACCRTARARQTLTSGLTVRKRSSTARPHPTLPRDAHAGDAGSSSANPPPPRSPSQGSDPQHRRATKRRRLEAESPSASSPPQRRISIVSALPPQAILASPESEDPQSPQLSEPPIMAEDAQQESDQQDTYTLHLQAIDPTQTTTPQDILQPPQTSHSPQLSPTPPQQQMAPSFGAVGPHNRLNTMRA
ncbi:serine/arginine repetitive matrix protein 1-like [Pseudophryne corroboree]|uniref:serine/arginine repetitive matrix protein 1-like n=1 Tax=Pseudophryne corroboree TaxID=495146 RepID=UPI003081DBB3